MKARPVVPYVILLLPALLLFGDTLFAPGQWVSSHPQYDAVAYYAPVRAFGFGEIARGHVPLWNPHAFSGNPFVAGFQSALFYPMNLHYLVLPLSVSMNIEIVLHVYLMGMFMYLWARYQGLSTAGSLFSAFVVQYSGPYFLRIYAGHLTYVDALAWAPLAFLAVDKTVRTRRVQWAFVGATALTMSILAGHPQAVYCTMLMLVPYSLWRLLQSSERLKTSFRLAPMALVPPLLSAPQLWTGIALSRESVRAAGLPYILVSILSFPPENLLTFVAPTVLGDVNYTGRWVFWETCGFMGIATFSLAAYAAVAGRQRARWVWLGLVALTIVIALGRYTPIFYGLFLAVPGMGSFRCPARFVFFGTMFLALLAGNGLDTLRQSGSRTKWIALLSGLLGIALLSSSGYLYSTIRGGDSSVWLGLIERLQVPGEVRWAPSSVKVGAACSHAAQSLLIAGITCSVVSALYLLAGKRRWVAFSVAGIAVIEVFAFARMYRESADLSARHKPNMEAGLKNGEQGFRVFDMAIENYPMEIGVGDMWGYDPTALLRYIELVAYTQDTRAEHEMTEFQFKWFHPMYAMFRCQYIIDSRGPGRVMQEFADPVPRAMLMDRYTVIPDKEERFKTLADPAFDPRARVVLETEPVPAPEAGETAGSVRIHDENSDAFVVDVVTPRPTILLMTDSYASDWHAAPIGTAPQVRYDILPANHALRAVPLAAGEHRIRFTYDPQATKWGWNAGILSCAFFVGSWIWVILRERRTMGDSQ